MRDVELTAREDAEKPLTVLLLPPADDERAVRDVVDALASGGGRPLIGALATPDALRLRTGGAELLEVDLAKGGLFGGRDPVRRLARTLASESVDIIHAWPGSAADVGLEAARSAGVRFVLSVDDPQASALRQSDGVIAPSHEIARIVAAAYDFAPDQIAVVPPAIDLDRFSEEAVSGQRAIQVAVELGLTEDTRPILLSPGSNAPGDAFETLMRAALTVAGERGASFLCMVAGGDAAAVGARIAEMGASRVMHAVERIADWPAALKLSTIFVSASETSPPSPRMIVEAQAMGRPVVAVDHGASADVIRHAESGWLHPAGDVKALATALNRALDMDESARAHMANAGRAQARARFSQAAFSEALADVYRRALA